MPSAELCEGYTDSDSVAPVRVVEHTHCMGGQARFTYDPAGNMLEAPDENRKTTAYTYDSMSRLATRTDPLARVRRFRVTPRWAELAGVSVAHNGAPRSSLTILADAAHL